MVAPKEGSRGATGGHDPCCCGAGATLGAEPVLLPSDMSSPSSVLLRFELRRIE
jgi:hypothetical protein